MLREKKKRAHSLSVFPSAPVEWSWMMALLRGHRSDTCWWSWPAPELRGLPGGSGSHRTALSVVKGWFIVSNVFYTATYSKWMAHELGWWVYLWQSAAAHDQISVVADFQQCGSKAPLICGTAYYRSAEHTLWCNPGNALHSFYKWNTQEE